MTLVSIAVLAPCFWHQRIGAGDLRSHVYNAWLVQLIARGEAPGLWIAHVRSNVLFDYLLSALARVFNLPDAGRIAAALVVLLFFWGSLAFINAITTGGGWRVTPVLAAITYGWTFQKGLLNYYLSLGLAFATLAFFVRRNSWRWVCIALVVPVAFLAHPLGVAWLLATAVYLALAQATPRRLQSLLVCSAIVVVFILRLQLQSHYRLEAPSHSPLFNLAFYNGLDQLMFTERYALPVLMLATLVLAAIIGGILRSNGLRELLVECSMPLQLYAIAQSVVLLVPDSIYLNQYPAPLSDLTARLTSISAVLVCALVGSISPRKWHLPVLLCSAALFFVFLYEDTAVLNRMEGQVENLVHSIPAGQRIISTISGPPRYRFSTKHMADVSCIEHCFSYGNYEAASATFRVRASQGNRFVVSDIHDAMLIEEGRYLVQATDLPLYQVYQCSPQWTVLCIRSLAAGEMNDLYGVHP